MTDANVPFSTGGPGARCVGQARTRCIALLATVFQPDSGGRFAWVKRGLGALHFTRPYFSLTAVDSYPAMPHKGPVFHRKVDICWDEYREQQ